MNLGSKPSARPGLMNGLTVLTSVLAREDHYQERLNFWPVLYEQKREHPNPIAVGRNYSPLTVCHCAVATTLQSDAGPMADG